jgi:integrase
MLTDTKLRALKPRSSVYRKADSNGLAIEVRPSGARIWRYRFRLHGKASMATLGEYPLVSLVEARRLRDEARKTLAAGVSPVTAARARRAARAERAGNTFAIMAAEFLAQRAKKLSSGSVKRERRLIEQDLRSIGNTPVADVAAKDLLAALRKIEQRGAVETAHRARSLAAQVFRYAIATGRAERNPAADLVGALASPAPGHFASVTDPDAVAPMLRAIHAYEETGTPIVVAALKLAPLVFVRPGELRSMRWANVDLDAAEWRFTASKTGTPHIVPLASQAVAILKELRPLTTGEYVFPSVRSVRRPMSENTLNAALRTIGYDGKTMTGHGFRAMARTILDEVLGFRPDYIEHQLAHAVRDPLGRAYNRTAHLPERQKMMQAWADYLDALRTNANVVSIRRNVG